MSCPLLPAPAANRYFNMQPPKKTPDNQHKWEGATKNKQYAARLSKTRMIRDTGPQIQISNQPAAGTLAEKLLHGAPTERKQGNRGQNSEREGNGIVANEIVSIGNAQRLTRIVTRQLEGAALNNKQTNQDAPFTHVRSNTCRCNKLEFLGRNASRDKNEHETPLTT